ncbi:MAG: RagB/SusD family nutrient uptake outer membrane protein [Tannerellaceae bacterium]|nr:RagB/SusD family nutrient uptake outer membrane protein [Tannerellaceae bacterium]
MKKILLASLIIVGILTGCSEFLDENPKSGMPQEEAYKSSTLVYLNTVASIYNSFSNYLYGNTDNIHYMQEFSSDAWVLPGRGADWVDGGKHQSMFLHNYDVGHATVEDTWNQMYEIIGNCNTALDKLKEIYDERGEDFLLEYQYEVRTIRAIFYYFLVDLYARIPVVTSTQMTTAEVKQSERSEVYEFILEELIDCLPHLASAKCQNSGSYYGRMTKAIGYMAIAKMALNSPIFTKDNWADGTLVGGIDAVANIVTEAGKNIQITLDGVTRNAWETVIYCQEQIANEGYSLESNFANNFSKNNESSVENIWIQPSDGTTYLVYNANQARTLHPQHSGAYGLEGWNGACATLEQLAVFKYGEPDQDPRMDLTFFYGEISVNGEVLSSGLNDGNNLVYNPLTVQVDFDATTVDDYVLKMAGARLAKYEIDNTTGSSWYQNNDKVYWRYADALLMAAEAKIRLGQSGDTEVNMVRDRVGATQKSNVTLKDILDERLLELSYEGMRRQDQVRFGTYTEPTLDRYEGVRHNVVTGDYPVDRTGYTTVFPIPQSVRELNPNLTQNTGY